MLRWKSEFANRVARQKMLQFLAGLKRVKHAGKRSENAIARIRMNTTKPEEKRELKGVNYAKNAVTE